MNGKAIPKKRKGRMKMWIIAVVVLLAASAGGGILLTAGERREGKNLPIRAVDFHSLKDGTYVGEYEGGKYKLRANRVQVTVSSGKVTDIRLLMHKENKTPEFTGKLYGRVIASQSLQVDTISGATITSKAYLKSVENALGQAQK
ncbi:FMN-binding protein [Paenibacillus oralis]|uniref:FMN-binding protein n=1 Tax=Paenibacillus oralis TaxID=2490856 RepID=A0A3P3U3A2_9BACL|nr:FMN-binding protein [Paenibacillus oralis]RRJ64765.1 FMN-binding protein [Paenibacillus oralis]